MRTTAQSAFCRTPQGLISILADRDCSGVVIPLGLVGISILAVLADRDVDRLDAPLDAEAISILAVLADRDWKQC